MILNATINNRLTTDLNTSHRVEIVVDSIEEAEEGGYQFWQYVLAFNRGLARAADEEAAA